MFAIIIPDEALLCDVAKQATAQHLHIISNGQRTALSPIIPDGWYRIAVKVRTPYRAQLEAVAA
jgi:hypothetical protein